MRHRHARKSRVPRKAPDANSLSSDRRPAPSPNGVAPHHPHIGVCHVCVGCSRSSTSARQRIKDERAFLASIEAPTARAPHGAARANQLHSQTSIGLASRCPLPLPQTVSADGSIEACVISAEVSGLSTLWQRVFPDLRRSRRAMTMFAYETATSGSVPHGSGSATTVAHAGVLSGQENVPTD